MALGDKGRRGKKLEGDKLKEVKQKWEEVSAAIDQAVTVEVGDFISELATAIRYRDRTGLTEGDWVEEPERLFTDNRVFGEEERIASNVKLQITLCIDCSLSMWRNHLMVTAGRVAAALDKYLTKAQQELPEGALNYERFVWAMGRKKYVGEFMVGKVAEKVNSDYLKQLEGVDSIPGNAGGDTYIAPLFKQIEQWEAENSDPNAFRLDIVLTDGVLEHCYDVQEATKIQERRNGRLTTALLNFLPRDQWSDYQLPDRCHQYAVSPETLTTTIRTILAEAIAELS